MDDNPRQVAAEVLTERHRSREFVERLLEQALARAPMAPVDRALCQELVYGTVRHQATLDWLIARKTEDRLQKPVIQNLLRLGLYQLLFLDRIPPHAAVDETVELAKHAGYATQAGFVNALLRGYVRDRDETLRLLDELKTTDPAVGWSHPGWLVERWRQRFGEADTAKLLEWNNTPPKNFARVNTLRTDAGTLLTRWRQENVAYDFFFRDWVEEGLLFELKSHPPLAQLASFREGLFYVQDPSTLLAVDQLAPKPGETVVDLCAAPGGKTTFMAQRMKNEGRLIACDQAEARVRLIRENCTRLGVTCVQPLVLPATDAQPGIPPSAALLGLRLSPADRVLVDAPCSNTGVLRRRVELRWRITPEEIQRLQRAQIELLRAAAALVKPGGVLVYSTCSLEPEENGDLVAAFLQAFPTFRLDETSELSPMKDGVDGAYAARLLRGPA